MLVPGVNGSITLSARGFSDGNVKDFDGHSDGTSDFDVGSKFGSGDNFRAD